MKHTRKRKEALPVVEFDITDKVTVIQRFKGSQVIVQVGPSVTTRHIKNGRIIVNEAQGEREVVDRDDDGDHITTHMEQCIYRWVATVGGGV